MKKYLYGKKKFLTELLTGKKGLRYSDIIYYSVMENNLMRDNELLKSFEFDKNGFEFRIQNILIPPADMVGGIKIDMPVQRCFCLCLSDKKQDLSLYSRFNADICIEIDVENLIIFLEIAAGKFDGMKVVHGPVNYYPPIMLQSGPDLKSILFYKRDLYAIESEYRIAITIPPHRTHFQNNQGDSIKIFSDDENDIHHLFISGDRVDINKSYIGEAYYPA